MGLDAGGRVKHYVFVDVERERTRFVGLDGGGSGKSTWPCGNAFTFVDPAMNSKGLKSPEGLTGSLQGKFRSRYLAAKAGSINCNVRGARVTFPRV